MNMKSLGSIKELLANAMGRNDEEPNIKLAVLMAGSADEAAVGELVGLLDHPEAPVRSDAIKVLYEISRRNADLIIPHLKKLVKLLSGKENRMIWGAMSALSPLSQSHPKLLVRYLPIIVATMEKGSAITRDHGIYTLCHVARLKKQYSNCVELLLEQIQKAPVNQVPMYGEKTAAILLPEDRHRLEKILISRKDVMAIPTKKKRIEKLLRTFQ